jgi:predicted nucleotide-binding protein (sugar kinase/HSP70/actin superfamily)
MEVILPRMVNVFRREFLERMTVMRDFGAKLKLPSVIYNRAGDRVFESALRKLEAVAAKHPLYERCPRLPEMAEDCKHILHRTFISGEGWLIPGEIVHFAKHGVKSFVVLQPFGCLPNHICGRGVIGRIKEDFPDIQILPLDFDPDTSRANIENRLQMLIMNEKSREIYGSAQFAAEPYRGAGGAMR